MSFPIEKFSSAGFILVPDTRITKERLFRYRAAGSKDAFFRITLTTPPLPYAEGIGLAMQLDSCGGEEEIFSIKNPFPQQKSYTGLNLAAAAAKGSRTITIGNLPASQTGAVPAGEFIRIGSSAKVYGVAVGGDSNISGRATVTLSQPLIKDYSHLVSVDYGSRVNFQVCMVDRDPCEVSAKNSKYIIHDVELIEQL